MSDDFGDLLTELHDDLPPPSRPLDDVKAAVLEAHTRRVRHRRARSMALVSAVCALGLGGLVVATQLGGRDQPVIRTDQSRPPATEPQLLDNPVPVASDPTATTRSVDVPVESGPTPWLRTIPDPPLADRVAELVVPMGDSVFVWGGFVPNHQDGSEPPFRDGAIADLDDGTWRLVADAPLDSGFATGVWTGSEVVVSNTGRIAAYDPAADSWRLLTLEADLSGETQYLALLGNEVVLPFAGWAWNVDDDTWRQIAVAPSVLTEPRMDVVGDDLVVSGAPVSVPTGTMALRYDAESDAWSKLSPPGTQVYQGDATGVVGNELVVVSWWSMRSQAMDLDTLRWRDLPTFPQFNVKCLGQLESVADSIAVVSMCGQQAALEPGADRWVAFDPPATSSTFDLHAVDGGLLVDGAVLDTDSTDWIRSPQLGPLSTRGATVDRGVQPEAIRSPAPNALGIADDATITVTMVAIDCVLEVGPGELVDQLTVSAALEQSQSSPQAVDFLNQFGSYSLSCPSSAAYSKAFDALTVRGERGEPQDALVLFDPPLPAADSPEKMADDVAEFVSARDEALGRRPSIGLSAPSGDPVTFLVDSYYGAGIAGGETYTITLAETDAGWVIVEATVQTICTRRPSEQSPIAECV
jgi:hypothetical protein